MTSKYDLPASNDHLARFVAGVIPSAPDPRDFHAAAAVMPSALPRRAMTSTAPDPVYQGDYGSCTAFGMGEVLAHEWRKVGKTLDPSENYFYARLREVEGTLCQNVGTSPRDAADLLVKEGVLPEDRRPYDQLDLCQGTGENERADGAPWKAASYASCRTLADIKAAIVADKKVNIAVNTTGYFVPDANGLLPRPDASQVRGGHDMVIEGYDDDKFGGALWVFNRAWGASWGLNGRCWFLYAWLPLAWDQGGPSSTDYWTLTLPAQNTPKPTPTPTPSSSRTVALWAQKDDSTWDRQEITQPVSRGPIWLQVNGGAFTRLDA